MGSVGANRAGAGGGGGGSNQAAQTADNAITGRTITRADIAALQQAMGQTGDEAGRANLPRGDKRALYVKTSKAFNINAYLNSDGNSISSPNSSWDWMMGYNKRMIANDIARIDSGMKPLAETLNLTRFVGGDSIGKMFGLPVTDSNVDAFISRLENDKSFASNFGTLIKNADYTHKAYTSTTYLQSHPSFGDRAVRLNIVARQNVPSIVTNNHAEAEILLGRNQKYSFGGWRIVNTGKRKQLIIDVII